ncbi:MAG: restriction endonuclease subunit S [Nitrospira sp.]|nr:restriction endonuclease subunit S [Nitrospira sp.]
MGKVDAIDIRPCDLETVREILRRHVPDKEVWAFGSRVQWTARDYSDLDLAIRTDEPIPLKVMGAISEELSESNLPMKVDVLDMASVSEKFRGIIEEEYAVVQESAFFHTLDECAILVREHTHPRNAAGMPYIGLEHIEEGLLHLKGHGLAEDVGSAKLKFKAGDILFGKLRPYFRKVIRAPFDGVCSTDIWVVRAKPGVVQDYIFYWMASDNFVNFANSGSEGTRMPRAKWEHAAKHKQRKASFEEQRTIAHILSTLDDKIELNRRMNKTLEAMAQAIFRSWFVDFDPVHAKAEGRDTGFPPEIADLFPDAFEDSELGEIPKGWEVKSLGEVAEITMGQSPPGNTYNKDGVGSPFYQGVADFQERYPKRRVFCTAPTRFAEQGDILLSVRAPVGRVNVATEWCSIGRGLAGIRTMESADQPFLEFALRKESERWRVLESQGSVFGNARKSDILHLPILWPKSEHRHVIARTLGTFGNTEQMNYTLAALRDTLLPVLLSGKIRRAQNHTVGKKPR